MMALFNEEYIRKAYGKEMFREGETRGEEKHAIATSRNLRDAGMSLSMISRMVGFPESVISGWLSQP